MVENERITVNYVVKNCNDGKVVHAVATEYYRKNKLISETAKSISFQTTLECILKSAFRKHAVKSSGLKTTSAVKSSQDLICEHLRLETGPRLFEPEPERETQILGQILN